MATVDNVARLLALGAKGSGGGGTGGTSNYPDLANKPQINGVELVGNKTSEDLGIEQGVTEEVLTQALAAEAASREKQDELLQGEIEGKIAAANILAGENIEVSQEGNNVTISSTAEGETYTAGTNIEITEDNVINNTMPIRVKDDTFKSSIAIVGDDDFDLDSHSILIGDRRSTCNGNYSVVIGNINKSGSTDFITKSNFYSVVIGYDDNVDKRNNVVVGAKIGVHGENNVVLGAWASSDNDNCVVLGKSATSDKENQFVLGSTQAPINEMKVVTSEGDKYIATTDLIPEEVPIATTEVAGKVKPDGKTITVDAEGIIKAISGGEVVHVIRNNDEKPFILEDNEVGYYLLDLDTLGTTTQVPGDPKVFSYGATPNDLSIVTVRDETTFILLKYHTDIKSNQTSEEVPVLTKYDFDITQDSFPTIYMNEYTCSYKNGEYRMGFGSSQYFRFAGSVDLPKKLSELKNDTNFINQEELDELLSGKQDKIDGTVATAENLTLERASENAKNLTLKVNGIEIGSIPAPQVQFNGATTFVAKEVKSFYEELGLVPETVNGFAWGSASDPAHGDINYLTEENGPYLVLTNINIENPVDLLGGNVIILKDILSTELPSPELLTIQFNGEDIGQYDGTEPKTINIQAATEEYVKQLVSTIQTASFEVVDSLPESDIKTNVIYLVPTQSSGIDNVYDEYVYVNNNWEKIGTTALDLSQYATKEYAEMVAANTINDTEVSNLTTYSSSKIESLSGIKVLTGTAEKPIIVSELETGNYVLSGTVQSSESNTTTQTLSKKVYTVEKGDSETVVWYENPKTHITYTYIFDTVGTNAPEEQDEIYITETQLKQAVIDGGNWAQEGVNNGKYNSY